MEHDINRFKEWVYQNLKIDLHAYKERQLHRRILTIMRSSGCKNLDEYKKKILSDETTRNNFLDYITINVTEFNRNKEIFDQFEKHVKSELLSKKREIKIWSAACSVGAEPYSLAIIFDKINPANRHTILATDLDEHILEQAKAAVYSDKYLKNLNQSDINKYFTLKNDKYYLDEKIKKRVQFKKHDLILDSYPGPFDVIVCRNVTIYFKSDARNEIYQKFSNVLNPGGLLFTGATESIYNPSEFGLKKLHTFIYQKIG
jgi:chemotaxis protein methyltransferase CheR